MHDAARASCIGTCRSATRCATLQRDQGMYTNSRHVILYTCVRHMCSCGKSNQHYSDAPSGTGGGGASTCYSSTYGTPGGGGVGLKGAGASGKGQYQGGGRGGSGGAVSWGTCVTWPVKSRMHPRNSILPIRAYNWRVKVLCDRQLLYVHKIKLAHRDALASSQFGTDPLCWWSCTWFFSAAHACRRSM